MQLLQAALTRPLVVRLPLEARPAEQQPHAWGALLGLHGGTSSGCFWWDIQRLLLVGHPAAASGAEAAPLAAGAASSDAELQWELQVAAVAEEQENAEMQWLQTLTDS